MRKFLHTCGHEAYIGDLYVTNGPLPLLIEQTYQHYLTLLNTLRSAVFDFPSNSWKGTYTERMVKHHATEMGHIRATAADYRMFVLETYIYLRNARREKFQDPSFMRALMDQMGRTGTISPEEHAVGPPSPGGTPSATRCAHCRRNGLHSGTDKASCTLKSLSKSKAQQALQGLNKAQAKKVAKAVAAALALDPATNVDEVISVARADV